ncbi:MAG: hypothetical protein GEV06_06550 [Luteitalea sp.]|nr:hypothetical protein [Luteitalea sp.]
MSKCALVGLAVGVSLFCALPAATTVSAQPSFERGWIDVNIGIAGAAEDSRGIRGTRIVNLEEAAFDVTYRRPRGADFDFGGGFMFTPLFGAGVSFTGTAHQDPADLAIRIPHPIWANAFGNASGETGQRLEHTEGGVHLQAMAALPLPNDRVRVRVFGGPTFFRAKTEVVTEIRYDQVYQIFGPGNAVEISEYDSVSIEETGWGFHGGGDVSVFFTRVVGVGGFARFSRGEVTIDDSRVLANSPTDLKVGGFQAGGGLRLKF